VPLLYSMMAPIPPPKMRLPAPPSPIGAPQQA